MCPLLFLSQNVLGWLKETIQILGGCFDSENRYDDILKYHPDGWIKIGKLKSARCYHGSSSFSTVALNSILPFCKK